MFLSKKYILANELVQEMGIHIANISMFTKNLAEHDLTAIKMGNCTFLNSNSVTLPKNITTAVLLNSFTDMSDKLPCTWVKSEYELREKELFKSGLVIDKVTIANKHFYVFAPEYAKKFKYKVPYILTEKEKNYCYINNQIDGSIQLGKDRFFSWY